MLKYHSQNEDPGTTAKRLEQLCVSLQTRLFKQVSQEQLESSILGYLNALGNQLPVKQMLARKLVEYFRENWPRIDAKTLEQLVQRRPEELDHLLGSIDSKDLAAFTEKILPFLRTKSRRKKPADKAEGQRNIKLAKNRYDRNRRYRPTGAGLIEIQFGKNALSPAPIRYLPPTCLDELFQGGEVKMAGGLQHCLEDLLGIDRHKMPKKLPSVRRGRQALLQFA